MEMWWIAAIAMAGIGAGMFREWLKFQANQRKVGEGLERKMTGLSQEKNALVERIENLEAIVASQTWNALQDKGLTPAERDLRVAATARHELASPSTEAANQQRVEQLARRLQG